MLTGEVITRVNDLSQSLHDSNIAEACEAVSNIIHDVANDTCGTVTNRSKGTYTDKSVPPCFRDKLKWASHNFESAIESYRQRTGDHNRRHTLIKCRKTLKRIKYLIDNYKKENNIKKIAALEKKDPKSFWSSIKRLNKHNSITPNITPGRWVDHFKQLLNMQSHSTDTQFAEYVTTALPTLGNCAEANQELNRAITLSELEKALKTMKSNKSPGPDKINNDMIKLAGPAFQKLLVCLYNKLLRSSDYPSIWKDSIISTIYKSGDVNMPNNYRGVAVSNSMHKLFTKIINSRIANYMTSNNKWAPNQNGFMEGRRPEDNVLIIQSLFHKYVEVENNPMYMAFIDFRKFFDIINRKFLMYKLLSNGITGDAYNVIKNMYNGTRYCVKTEKGLTDYVISDSGVLQGCNLSPTLSNIFQNDLHSIFGDSTDPLHLNDSISLNSLSWADDLVLMSNTHRGLQNCLRKLDHYCSKWGLVINADKSKVMIMKKGTPDNNSEVFTLGGSQLEKVNQYKYLGVISTHNGKFKRAVDDRILKATRCCYSVRNAISHYQTISTRLATSLFEKQISPILLYGCPLWATENVNREVTISFPDLNWFANVQAKNLLDNFMDKDVMLEKSTINRQSKSVTVTFRSWSDKQTFIQMVTKRPVTFTFSDSTPKRYNPTPWDPIIKVQSKFLKSALGVSKFTSSTGVYRELGQYPITLKATSLCLMYYHRLMNLSATDPNNVILQATVSQIASNHHPWNENIQYMYNKHGLGDLLKRLGSVSKYSAKRLINLRLRDEYMNSTMPLY